MSILKVIIIIIFLLFIAFFESYSIAMRLRTINWAFCGFGLGTLLQGVFIMESLIFLNVLGIMFVNKQASIYLFIITSLITIFMKTFCIVKETHHTLIDLEFNFLKNKILCNLINNGYKLFFYTLKILRLPVLNLFLYCFILKFVP